MNTIRITAALGAVLMAGSISTGSFGQESGSECLRELRSLHETHGSTRAHLGEAERRNLKTLRQAARVLDGSDQDDACERVVEALGAILSDQRNQLVDKGVVLEIERERRLAALAEAKAIDAAGSALRASDILGSDFRNLEDEDLGEIEDVILDGSGANIAYLLVSTGGFLGLGDDLVAVPAGLVRATPSFNTIVLSIAPDDLGRAPEVELAKLDRTTESDWQNKNRRFFEGVVPRKKK